MAEMQSKPSEKDWRDLAVVATRETNPEKMCRIIEELCGVLDKRRAQQQSQTDPPAKKSA
jgi:hypothetical protein